MSLSLRTPTPTTLSQEKSSGIADKLRLFGGGVVESPHNEGNGSGGNRKLLGENGESVKRGLALESSEAGLGKDRALPPLTPIKNGLGIRRGKGDKKERSMQKLDVKEMDEVKESLSTKGSEEDVDEKDADGLMKNGDGWKEHTVQNALKKGGVAHRKTGDAAMAGEDMKPAVGSRASLSHVEPASLEQLKEALRKMDDDIERLRLTLNKLQQIEG